LGNAMVGERGTEKKVKENIDPFEPPVMFTLSE